MVRVKHLVKDIPPDPISNIIFEVQVPEETGYTALGWSLLNLFQARSLNLNSGIFKISLYQQPTNPSLHISQISSTLAPIN